MLRLPQFAHPAPSCTRLGAQWRLRWHVPNCLASHAGRVIEWGRLPAEPLPVLRMGGMEAARLSAAVTWRHAERSALGMRGQLSSGNHPFNSSAHWHRSVRLLNWVSLLYSHLLPPPQHIPLIIRSSLDDGDFSTHSVCVSFLASLWEVVGRVGE